MIEYAPKDKLCGFKMLLAALVVALVGGASPRRPLHFGPLGERVLPFSGAFGGCCTIRWMSPLEKCFCIVKSCFVTL